MLTANDNGLLAVRFDRALEQYGVAAIPVSPLQATRAAANSAYMSPPLPGLWAEDTDAMMRPRGRTQVAALAVMTKFVRVHELGGGAPFAEHLSAIGWVANLPADGSHKRRPSDPPRGPAAKDYHDRLFELLVGLSAAEAGGQVRFAPARAADTSDPDLLVTLDGVSLALACRTLRRRSMDQLLEAAEHCAARIDASDADRRCLLLDLHNPATDAVLSPPLFGPPALAASVARGMAAAAMQEPEFDVTGLASVFEMLEMIAGGPEPGALGSEDAKGYSQWANIDGAEAEGRRVFLREWEQLLAAIRHAPPGGRLRAKHGTFGLLAWYPFLVTVAQPAGPVLHGFTRFAYRHPSGDTSAPMPAAMARIYGGLKTPWPEPEP